MRIAGGQYRGRRLAVPAGIRPTQERVREALFSSLGDRVDGCRFLDLCAGSGAVGLEALSRGAAAVCWVERSARNVAALRRNAEALAGPLAAAPQLEIVKGDAGRYLDRWTGAEPFDIIFADPPYLETAGGDWLTGILQRLGKQPVLRPGGWLVVEQDSRDPEAERPGWELVKKKIYGGTRLCYFAPRDNEPIADA